MRISRKNREEEKKDPEGTSVISSEEISIYADDLNYSGKTLREVPVISVLKEENSFLSLVKEKADNFKEEGIVPSDNTVREKPVITADHVTMEFKRQKDEASSLKEYAVRMAKGKKKTEKFKALDNISFTIYEGEIVGIIGTNGSGKSTLLKIISGALAPTEGTMEADRESVQLLTLGTGFDPELTGKENVYLNGAIIGYSREFIDENYDKIVKFAELEDFMDEKIKNYSSGMVSRLGFAIATAGDAPGILILDEVLSVGDMFFRKKSEKRIQEMIHGGSTVLIVSHSTGIIKKNCTRAIWIEKGKFMMDGEPAQVCSAYERMSV